MTDGYGLIFCPWCGQSNPCGCWRKTLSESLASSLTALHGSSVSLSQKATKHSVTLSAPTMSVRPTGESASGSWATPVAQPANGTPEDFLRRKRESVARGNTMGICLSDLNMQVQVAERKDWQTPTSADGGSKSRGGKRKGELLLGGQVKAWPTPRSEDSEQTGAHRGTPDTLTSAARQWPTPNASLADGGHGVKNCSETGRKPDGSKASVDLSDMVKREWPTPNSMDAERGAESRATKKARNSGGVNLREAANWPTPKSRDVKGQSQRGEHQPGDALPNMVGLHAPASDNTTGKPRGLLNFK